MLTLIENGEVYSPELMGKASILFADGLILKVGDISVSAVKAIDADADIIDAKGCIVTPGFLDPHQHLLGGSGEEGFATQTSEITASEVIEAGITTVVGCLGVDTTMKTLAGLLAKTKALKEEGLNAYMWTGGYNVPPTTITHSVRDDIMFIEEVIGTGEVAVSDERSTEPEPKEIARVAHDAYIGGMLSKKAGLVHFHVGKLESRLKLLFTLIEKHDVKAEWLYATHINRSDKLMLEAIDLAKKGSYVDLDTVDEDLVEKLSFYLENGGPKDKITVSSDASKTSPGNLYSEIRRCIIDGKMSIKSILPLVTSNTAEALKLAQKGRIAEAKAADLLVITKDTFELVEVISSGKRLFRGGKLAFKEQFLDDSNRKIVLEGKKSLPRSDEKLGRKANA